MFQMYRSHLKEVLRYQYPDIIQYNTIQCSFIAIVVRLSDRYEGGIQ